MLDSESKLREAIQKMLEARTGGGKKSTQSDEAESMEDLFGEESKPAKKDQDIEDLFK
jgi:hypothetical protein